MLFIKGIYLLLSHLPTSHTFGGCLTTSSAITHRIAPSAQYIAIGEKTAEERFNTLARGWLAYPVTPKHHPSTAEERLYMLTPRDESSVCK